jgi:LPXTG-motif cell wall-anchored protein
MEKMYLILAESGSKSGMSTLYFVIAALVLIIAGYFLLRKKKK